MMKKLIVTVVCLSALGVILAGCQKKVDAEEINSEVKPPTEGKVNAEGTEGQGGGALADMEIDN